jgi:hypothetical protein
VPLQGVGRGTFRITVDYTLRGTQGAFTSVCSDKAPQAFLPGLAASPGTHSQDITVKCGGGTLWFFMSAGPGASLAVSNLVVAKTSVD